jgi:hypothetical protein
LLHRTPQKLDYSPFEHSNVGMRRFLLILLVCFQADAFANGASPGGNFGLGLTVGSFYAVTGKYFVDKRSAVDFGVAFDDLGLYADYVYHIPNIFGKGSKFTRETAGYFGGGGGVMFWDNSYECGRFGCDRHSGKTETGVFVRGFAGFEWYAAPTKFGVFAEVGPMILLTPDTDTDFDVQVGGRFYF